jgi:hypothetical protein
VAVFLADTCITVVILNRKISKEANGKSQFSKTAGIFTLILTLLTVLGSGYLLILGEKEPRVTLFSSNSSIEIEAMYGRTIPSWQIQEISLINQNMNDIGVGSRTNGYGGLSPTLKGHFSSDGLVDHLLFVDAGSSPTICIKRNGAEDVYLSFKDSEKTKALYEQLQAIVL